MLKDNIHWNIYMLQNCIDFENDIDEALYYNNEIKTQLKEWKEEKWYEQHKKKDRKNRR